MEQGVWGGRVGYCGEGSWEDACPVLRQECKKGAVSEQQGWRPSRPWYTVAGPGSGDPQRCLLPSALPAKTSQPGGLRQPQRRPREARVSMATLTSWTWGPERCLPPPPASLAQPQLGSAAAGRDIRGVGAASLPSDLSCPGPQTGVSQASQVSGACYLPNSRFLRPLGPQIALRRPQAKQTFLPGSAAESPLPGECAF